MTPLVTISIPTLNSQGTLKLCLESIKKQNYKNIEVNIIDGGSIDETINIAKNFKVKKIIHYKKALLGARYEGVKIAKGKYTLLLDSDQILEKNTIRRSVEVFSKEKVDMLALEEAVYKADTFIEKLFSMDRKLIEAVKDFNPSTSTILPRFYKTSLLKKTFKKIPKKALEEIGGQDHAVIYFEIWQLSQKIDSLPKAVKHIEPDTVLKLAKKFFRWGENSINEDFGKYNHLLTLKRVKLRTGSFKKGLIQASLGSMLLLFLKGFFHIIGYYYAKLEKLLLLNK